MFYPKIVTRGSSGFKTLPQGNRFRILTMPYKYYAHVIADDSSYKVGRCPRVGPTPDTFCNTCTVGRNRAQARYALLVRDQDTYDICLWDIDMFTYHSLSRFHKVNKHFDIDLVMEAEEFYERDPNLARYVITPVLGSSGVPEFYDEPKDWFDRYMASIVFADDCGDRAGKIEWGSRPRPRRNRPGPSFNDIFGNS